jgi:hypothetical protein
MVERVVLHQQCMCRTSRENDLDRPRHGIGQSVGDVGHVSSHVARNSVFCYMDGASNLQLRVPLCAVKIEEVADCCLD